MEVLYQHHQFSDCQTLGLTMGFTCVPKLMVQLKFYIWKTVPLLSWNGLQLAADCLISLFYYVYLYFKSIIVHCFVKQVLENQLKTL